MQDSLVEQLRRLAASDSEEAKKHYKAICDQRDTILARAIMAAAKHFLEESGYRSNPALTSEQNNQQAMKLIEEHLAKSSISEADQDILALVGTGALVGWTISQAQEEDAPQKYLLLRIDKNELDPMIVHRLAKALERSPDHEPLLKRFTTREATKLPQPEADLVTAATHMLLSDMSISGLEEDLRKIIITSILGG